MQALLEAFIIDHREAVHQLLGVDTRGWGAESPGARQLVPLFK